MTRFDRYILSQLITLFGFFSLVLIAMFWISRAVPLFDRLIADGQGVLVFFEFSTLSLPNLISTILPLAIFASSVYITNRMNNESELIILKAAGASPWRLARPFFLFGLICALMMSVLVHFLKPTAAAQLDLRENEISQNVTARLLSEGTFLTPTDGITLYSRLIAQDGELQDVFFFDTRDPKLEITYTAAKAYLVHDSEQSALIMLDGLIQTLNKEQQTLSTAQFRDFSFDISSLIQRNRGLNTTLSHLKTPEFFTGKQKISRLTGADFGAISEEFHSRFMRVFFCILAAIIGFATLQLSGFSRFGVWREIVIALVLLILIDGSRTSFAKPVFQDDQLWPLIYMPIVIGAIICLFILAQSAHPNWYKRKRFV